MPNSLEMESFDVVPDGGESPRQQMSMTEVRNSANHMNRMLIQTWDHNPAREEEADMLMEQLTRSQDNPLRRSQRSNAMYTKGESPYATAPLSEAPLAAKKRSRYQSVNLAKSAYVRDAASFSVMQKDIASGKSKWQNFRQNRSKCSKNYRLTRRNDEGSK